jgi:hypothetical protein
MQGLAYTRMELGEEKAAEALESRVVESTPDRRLSHV